MIQVILWLPLAAGLLAALVPRKITPWIAVLGAGIALGLGIGLLAGFDSDVAGLQHPVDESWTPELGVRYQLGVDGLNVFLMLLTSVAWFAVTLWGALRTPERDKDPGSSCSVWPTPRRWAPSCRRTFCSLSSSSI